MAASRRGFIQQPESLAVKPAVRRGSPNTKFQMAAPRGPSPLSPASLHRVSEYPTPKGVKQGWTHDAFAFYETIDEVGYVVDLTANTIGKCGLRLVREVLVDAETGDEIANPVTVADQADTRYETWDATDRRAQRVDRGLQGPRGGKKQLLIDAGRLLTICGETYLLGTPVPDDSQSTKQSKADVAAWWEFLSPLELMIPDGGLVSGSAPQGFLRTETGHGKEEIDRDAFVARCWRRDARWSGRSSSALRRVLRTCRHMLMLDQMLESIIRTRMPMGILLVPSSLAWQSPLDRQDETVTGGLDDPTSYGHDAVEPEEEELVAVLIQHLSAPVEDLASPASLVPLVLTGDPDQLDKVRLVELGKQLDTYMSSLRGELVGRMARGLDIPPEILTGKGDSNHWGAYEVAQDFVTRHVIPAGELIADFLTYAYLQPMLQIAEQMDPDEASAYSYEFDPSALLARADEAASAMRLWETGPDLVSDRAVVAKAGLDPDLVMPDEDEVLRRRLWTIFIANPALVTEEGLTLLGIDPKYIDVTALAPSAPPPFGPPPVVGQVGPPPVDTTSGTDEPVKDDTQPGQGNAAASVDRLIDRLCVRCDADLANALRTAGSRLVNRTKNSSCPNALRGRFTGVAKERILGEVTPEEIRLLGCGLDFLLEDAWVDLRVHAAMWIRDHLLASGVERFDADSRSVHAATKLCSAMDDLIRANGGRMPPVGDHGHRTPKEVPQAALDVATGPTPALIAGVAAGA